jgi:hypothetical protein
MRNPWKRQLSYTRGFSLSWETPGVWQLHLLFGALPNRERGLEKEWSNPSFDHLQLRGTKKNENIILLFIMNQ